MSLNGLLAQGVLGQEWLSMQCNQGHHKGQLSLYRPSKLIFNFSLGCHFKNHLDWIQKTIQVQFRSNLGSDLQVRTKRELLCVSKGNRKNTYMIDMQHTEENSAHHVFHRLLVKEMRRFALDQVAVYHQRLTNRHHAANKWFEV